MSLSVHSQIVGGEDLLAASFVDYYVRVWRLSTGQLLHAIDVGTPIVQYKLCHYTTPQDVIQEEPPSPAFLYTYRSYHGLSIPVPPSSPPQPSHSGMAYFIVINTGHEVSTYKFDPATHALLGEDIQEVESSSDCYTRQVYSMEWRGVEIWVLVQQTELWAKGAVWQGRSNRLVYDRHGPGRGVCYSSPWLVYEYPDYGREGDACNFGYLGCGHVYDVLCYSVWSLRQQTWVDRVCIYRKGWGVAGNRGSGRESEDRRATLVGDIRLKHTER